MPWAALLMGCVSMVEACIVVEQGAPRRPDAGTVSDAATSDVAVDGGVGPVDAAALRAGATVYASNRHAYLVVCDGRISWDDARRAALSAGGYLATLTSKSENNFVAALAAQPLRPECWEKLVGPWLGAQRNKLPDGGAGAWTWLTAEGWDDEAANWHPSQPDNAGNKETALQAYDFTTSFVWNDNDPNKGMPGYVIEWDK